jgi:serralysin
VLHYAGGAGEVNHVQARFKLTPIMNDFTGQATITDSAPITVGFGCAHPNPADTKTAVCTVYLGEELPVLDLGDRNDSLTSQGDARPYVLDGPGDDSITAKSSAVWADGPGNDAFQGGPARDEVRRPHGFGDDVIFTGAGNDLVYAGGGVDLVHGGTGDDALYGDAGGDRIYGDSGRDHIVGGAGLDTMFGGPGVDSIDGRTRNVFRG